MVYYESNYLCHYGLKGMKWGTRRWQFDDGRFNDAGKARYFGQNSSHRPDSVRKLQGDPPKSNRSSAPVSNGGGRSFDKEKAKKIAKGVAIGTAVVGGTVLAVYGAKKINDLGGVSKIAQNAVAKHREVKLENLKATEEFKSSMAEIRSEGKMNRAKLSENAKSKINEIRNEGKDARTKANDDLKRAMSERRESMKTDLTKFREDAKTEREKIKFNADLDRRMNQLDPEGKINRDVLRSELIRRNAAEASMRAKGAAGGREGQRLAENYVRETRSRIQNEIANLSSTEVKRLNSGEASLLDLRKERGMSGDAYPWESNASKVTSSAHGSTKVRNVASNASKNVKNVTEKVKSTKLPKITPDHLKAGTEFLSEFNKSVQTASQAKREQQARDAAAVKEYRKEHPNTKLSDKQIIKNYGS